jgi:putative peptidoglycan lipid II flippase
MKLDRILKSFFSLSVLTVLSRASGFIKVAAIAAFYGRSVEADMLTAVMVLPDLVYKFLSEGLVSGAAVPIFVNNKDDKTALNEAFWSIFWITAIVGTILSVALALGTNQICALLMPEIDSGFELVLRRMWLILIPYLVLGLFSGVQTSLLNSRLSFAMPAIGALLVNLSIITGTFIAAGKNIEIIAVANTVGALIQVLWLFILIYKDKILESGLRSCLAYKSSIAKDYLKASSPVIAWVSILPLIPVYERHLLSADAGGISTLNYTEKLFNLPLGVIAISLAHVILPNLSLVKGKERIKFLAKSLSLASIVIIPIILVIWFGADYIVKIVFMRGKFSLEDVDIAANLFRFYSIALLPVSLNLILNRGFFAARSYRIPFVAGLIAALLQIYLCYSTVPSYGMKGIAIAAISAGFTQFIILLVMTIRISNRD